MSDNSTVPNTPTPAFEQIALQIKSLEQRTTSVTLPRTASVLELKHEIQSAFDVESNRQRLIFQGRVLKDGKNLTDYANLDNGKVIHLVIRPADVPHNPVNDDPNPGVARPGLRNIPFDTPGSIRSRMPMMEGYAFITLDTSLSELGDGQTILSSVLNNLSPNGTQRTRATGNSTQASNNNNTSSTTATATTNTEEGQTNNNNALPARTNPFSVFQRSPFAFSFGHRSTPTTFPSSTDRLTPSVPFPASVEVRLVRTLGSIRNVRTMLEDPTSFQDSSNMSSLHYSSTPQLQEIRNRIRAAGPSQSAQIGMVVNELASLMAEVAPRLREAATQLRENNQSETERTPNLSRIIQGMSLINHFLGSVLSSADVEARRRPETPATNIPAVRLPQRILSPVSSAIRQPPTPPSGARPKKTEKSALSNSMTEASSSSSESNKRKAEDEMRDPKRTKDDKGKGKDKTD